MVDVLTDKIQTRLNNIAHAVIILIMTDDFRIFLKDIVTRHKALCYSI